MTDPKKVLPGLCFSCDSEITGVQCGRCGRGPCCPCKCFESCPDEPKWSRVSST
jgi:hypothetical protein